MKKTKQTKTLTLYYTSNAFIATKDHHRLQIDDARIPDIFIRVVVSSKDLEHALGDAQPIDGEVVLNTVEVPID